MRKKERVIFKILKKDLPLMSGFSLPGFPDGDDGTEGWESLFAFTTGTSQEQPWLPHHGVHHCGSVPFCNLTAAPDLLLSIFFQD